MQYVRKNLIYGIKSAMKFKNVQLLKNIKKKKDKIITVDGITCSGKSLFANILKKKLSKYFKNVKIISKDLFLLPRERRIIITKNRIKTKTKFFDQNQVHYDLVKVKKLFSFLSKKTNLNKTFILKNLYDRKTGRNIKTEKFTAKNNTLFIYEGLFVNDDIKNIKMSPIKILLIERIYESLSRKIERIRDKKISIGHVVYEFSNIHLNSFARYLSRNKFNHSYYDVRRNFLPVNNGKKKQISLIKKFIQKHSF